MSYADAVWERELANHEWRSYPGWTWPDRFVMCLYVCPLVLHNSHLAGLLFAKWPLASRARERIKSHQVLCLCVSVRFCHLCIDQIDCFGNFQFCPFASSSFAYDVDPLVGLCSFILFFFFHDARCMMVARRRKQLLLRRRLLLPTRLP